MKRYLKRGSGTAIKWAYKHVAPLAAALSLAFIYGVFTFFFFWMVDSLPSWLIILSAAISLSSAVVLAVGGGLYLLHSIRRLEISHHKNLTVLRVIVKDRIRDKDSNSRPFLFISSNGAGLGHLTRLLSIAEKLGNRQVSFFTFSRGAFIARDKGFVTGRFTSPNSFDGSNKQWREAALEMLLHHIVKYKPELILFDGTSVYAPVREASAIADLPLYWMRRGNWKSNFQFKKSGFALPPEIRKVLIPDEQVTLSEGLRVQTDPSNNAIYIPPIASICGSDLLQESDAKTALGLELSGRYYLINLGSMPQSDASYVRRLLEKLNENFPEFSPVFLKSPLVSSEQVKEMESYFPFAEIEVYPIAPFLLAFEFIVSACGYNSILELEVAGRPALLVPNPSTKTDDQLARAHRASETNANWMVIEGPEELNETVELFRNALTLSQPISGKDDNEERGFTGALFAAHLLQELLVENRQHQ